MKLTRPHGMHDYSPATVWYWSFIVTIGIAVIAYAFWQLFGQPWRVIAMAAAGAATTGVVALFPVNIAGKNKKMALGACDIFIVLTLLLAGLPAATIACAVEAFTGTSRLSSRWTSRLLTTANNAAALLACGWVFERVRPAVQAWIPDPLGLFIMVTAFGVIYFNVQWLGIRFFFALRRSEPVHVLSWWIESYLGALWGVSSAAIAGLIYLALESLGWSALFVAIPVIALFLATYWSLQRTAEISRRKSEFLAHMSHELRTPLNAIIGGSQVLKDGFVGPLTPKQGQWASDIHESGEHLLAVINDILDISKIEAGSMQLERGVVEVRVVVDGAITLVRDAAARKRIDLHSYVSAHTGSFAVDERKIKQVLLNLLSNAIKFTPEGGQVRVMARRDGAAVEVAVHDTGVGIAPEDQKAVFEAFRQVGKDTAAKAMGTGLGLTLARDLVQLHGGTLALQSEPGHGSVFTLRLPDPA